MVKHLSGIRPLDFSKSAINQKNDNGGIICQHNIIVTGPRFMSLSWMVWKCDIFYLQGIWPVNQKSEIPLSEVSPVSGDWWESEMPNWI